MTVKEEIELKRRQVVIHYKNCFDTFEGKSVLEDLAKFCYENESTFCVDPHDAAFKEGARAVILYVRRQLAKDLQTPKQEAAINENSDPIENKVPLEQTT
jgi:hypothetical protein